MSQVRKHVHFDSVNVYYSAPPTPPTPSPSYSVSSLPESDGPFTPPSPFGTVPLPPNYSGIVQVHSALAYCPDRPTIIHYNVIQPPSTVTLDPIASPSGSKLRAILAQPATNPPLPSMTLLSDFLPYPITVNPGSVASVPSPYAAPGAPFFTAGSYVTVNDVLTALYTFLRRPMSKAEITVLPPPGQAARLAMAYQSRIQRIVDDRERHVEKEKGVKRIDMLIAHGKTQFAGLTATMKGPQTWALALA